MAKIRTSRWAVPAAAIALLIVGSGLASLPASAAPLPERTPEQLLVDLQTSGAVPLQGTVTETVNLGLPALPVSPKIGGASLESLLTGTNTLRVWADGSERGRVALLANQAESDVIRNGRDVWVWQSANKTAQHITLPADNGQPLPPRPVPTEAPKTPQEWADLLLAQARETTTVTASEQTVVAGRPAYELILTPKAADSRVKEVRLAVDGEKHVPLRVQVFSTVLDSPAIEVGFTTVSFTAPDPAVFTFSPAEGVTVTETTPPARTGATPAPHDKAGQGAGSSAAQPTITGTSWATIVSGRFDPALLTGGSTGSPGSSASNKMDPASLLKLLPAASGSWGSGHVLDGTLFSVVVTDDGRYAAGAVAPAALYAALPAR